MNFQMTCDRCGCVPVTAVHIEAGEALCVACIDELSRSGRTHTLERCRPDPPAPGRESLIWPGFVSRAHTREGWPAFLSSLPKEEPAEGAAKLLIGEKLVAMRIGRRVHVLLESSTGEDAYHRFKAIRRCHELSIVAHMKNLKGGDPCEQF